TGSAACWRNFNDASCDLRNHGESSRRLAMEPPVLSKNFARFPAALVDRGQLRGIYVLGDGGLLHWHVVTVGRHTADLFEVLSGLNDGGDLVDIRRSGLDGALPHGGCGSLLHE